jgi:hypothetical protein
MSTFRSIDVQYRFDPESPVINNTVKFSIDEPEMKTEIVFPTGKNVVFDSWDVKGVRKSYFLSEVLRQNSLISGTAEHKDEEVVNSIACTIARSDYGVTPDDVARFVAELATKPKNECLFETPKAEPEPEPESKTVRKFPYLQVARLWNEGKSTREIGIIIGYLDSKKDSTHTMRTFLTKMHKGYKDENGIIIKLPHRDRVKTAGVGV